MKRLALLLLLVSALLARAEDPKVTVVITDHPANEPSTVFSTLPTTLYALFKTDGGKTGDKIKGVWVAQDLGPQVPKFTKILETTTVAKDDNGDGAFSLNRPVNGWPPGKYRLEIYVNDKLAGATEFSIKP